MLSYKIITWASIFFLYLYRCLRNGNFGKFNIFSFLVFTVLSTNYWTRVLKMDSPTMLKQ